MSYRIAGIDVHKKMLAVVVSDVEIESEYQSERRMFEIERRILPHHGNASFGSIERRLPAPECGDRRTTSAMPIAPRKGTAPTFAK